MKSLALAAALAVATPAFLAVPAPAEANVFCPATVVALTSLALVARPNSYGVLLEFDPGDTASVRLRVDSEQNRYAVDFNDIEPIGLAPLRVRRYFSLPLGERAVIAWVESTGTRPDGRAECPITSPWAADAPAPIDPRVARSADADRRALIDSFSTRTPLATPQSFGKAEPLACAQPYAPPRAILPVEPEIPPQARAVRAAGTTIVRVDLDETSSVLGVAVVRSSGFAPLDRAAATAAAKSSYRTETFACRSIASSYQYAISTKSGP